MNIIIILLVVFAIIAYMYEEYEQETIEDFNTQNRIRPSAFISEHKSLIDAAIRTDYNRMECQQLLTQVNDKLHPEDNSAFERQKRTYINDVVSKCRSVNIGL